MDQPTKILISSHADQCLESMLKTVNEGFTSGRVRKAQLASWVLLRFSEQWFAKQIDAIRADHFDEIAHLKSVVKQMEKAKKTAQSLELESLLSPLKNGGGRIKKRVQAVDL